MPALSVLIKPASGLCNMRCRYCFYADVTENREVRSYGVMTEETAEALIRRALEFAEGSLTFAFQGGEPTLAGEGYYRFFTETVKRLNEKRIPVNYAMQTNGYEISDGLCDLLAQHRFLMGVSLDGTGAFHDAARPDARGEGTFRRVNGTIAKFRERGIDFNILTVVTERTAKNISSVYRYLRSRGFRYVQFIKHVDGFGDAEDPDEWSLSPARYANFLKTAFRIPGIGHLKVPAGMGPGKEGIVLRPVHDIVFSHQFRCVSEDRLKVLQLQGLGLIKM